MHNSPLVEFSNTDNDLSCVKLCDLFVKSFVLFEDLVKLSTIDEWHNIKEAQLRLKEVLHSTEEWVIRLKQNLYLELCRC